MKLKNTHVIAFFLFLSSLLLIYGLFAEVLMMKFAVLGIIILTVFSFALSWLKPINLAEKSILLATSVSTAYAFFTFAGLICIIFLMDLFIAPVTNLTFGIFASLFVSMIVARMYISNALK